MEKNVDHKFFEVVMDSERRISTAINSSCACLHLDSISAFILQTSPYSITCVQEVKRR